MLKVLVIGGFCKSYINKCIDSILNQSFNHFKVHVVIDNPCDGAGVVVNDYPNDRRISFRINDNRLFAMENIVSGIKELNCKDEDVIALVDGDDWLNSLDAFKIVADSYIANPNLLMTYGSWIYSNTGERGENCTPYSYDSYFNGIRHCMFQATPLRTFKYKLFKNIPDCFLRDVDNTYYKSGYDIALMIPMIEMSGFNRTKWIQEEIYTYNIDTPYNDSKIDRKEQMRVEQRIINQPPFKLLEEI